MKPEVTMCRSDVADLEAMMDGLDDRQFPDMEKLLDEIDRAEIVDDDVLPGNVVRMNSWVSFVVAASGREFSVQLVYPQAQKGLSDRVSITSPLGSAILGLSEGAAIDWPLASGKEVKVTVNKVKSS